MEGEEAEKQEGFEKKEGLFIFFQNYGKRLELRINQGRLEGSAFERTTSSRLASALYSGRAHKSVSWTLDRSDEGPTVKTSTIAFSRRSSTLINF